MNHTALPRPLAVTLLLVLACTFAANHIGARIAFDHGVGVIVAVLCRSGVTALALAAVLWWQREWPRLPAGTARWQLLLGALISLQSVCLYAAVARIPVALALLIFNTFPILLALLGWLLGGQRPTARTAALMAADLGAELLVLLTTVDQVYVNFGRTDQRPVERIAALPTPTHRRHGTRTIRIGPRVRHARVSQTDVSEFKARKSSQPTTYAVSSDARTHHIALRNDL